MSNQFSPPSGPPPGQPQPQHGGNQRPPPAGIRTPCSTTSAFPDLHRLGEAPFRDLSGDPVFVASAIMGDSVHPCKAAPHLQPPIRVPWGGGEQEHHGRYDILPITHEMEWVPTAWGRVPEGRRPVEGGYEANGEHLFHAAATLGPEHQNIRLPGKTGVHLGAANFAFGGVEIVRQENYEILCWR